MKQIFLALLLCLSVLGLQAQRLPTDVNGYHFKDFKQLGCTDVKNQYKSGTCWVYSTNSFIESELMRMGKGNLDLSDMFIVRGGYLERADNYVRRQGAAAFGQGAENHDVWNVAQKYGVVPQSAYSGFPSGQDKPNHAEMEAVLKAMLDAINKNPGGTLSKEWKAAFAGALDGYMGHPPSTFTVDGKEYTPQSYFQSLGVKPSDYVALTSYSHHPYYKPFVLEVSDNWSNGQFYNVPIDEFVSIADNAVARGFSVLWAADVSEKGFSAKEGLVVMPEKAWGDMSQGERDSVFKAPVKEKWATQDDRQAAFDEMSTTDDHGMHIVGSTVDQNNTKYYLVKNSWGTDVNKTTGGYIYVSQPYFRYKTMSMMVHKDAIPADLRKKMGL